MGLSASKIRRIIERHPLPDKHLNDILQQWMIELAEELADNLLENVETSDKLASKEDIQQIRSDIKEMRQETKDDIKQLIEMSNARFESLRQEMNTRFEAQQKETNALRQEMNTRFEAMEKSNSARFEAMEKANAARFEALQKEMNARFEALQRQIAFMQWWFSIGGGITLLLIILKLFFPHIFPHWKIFLFYQIFYLYLHTNKIQIMHNVFQHNISQVATRKSQVKLVHLKHCKVRSFFLSFQTVRKNFFFSSFLSLISYFDSS